jgi:hypothetical protein
LKKKKHGNIEGLLPIRNFIEKKEKRKKLTIVDPTSTGEASMVLPANLKLISTMEQVNQGTGLNLPLVLKG